MREREIEAGDQNDVPHQHVAFKEKKREQFSNQINARTLGIRPEQHYILVEKIESETMKSEIEWVNARGSEKYKLQVPYSRTEQQ